MDVTPLKSIRTPLKRAGAAPSPPEPPKNAWKQPERSGKPRKSAGAGSCLVRLNCWIANTLECGQRSQGKLALPV
jgi:hypothetical protein